MYCWIHALPALPVLDQSGLPSVGLAVFFTAYTFMVPIVVPCMLYQKEIH